jgi:hypothetical protein
VARVQIAGIIEQLSSEMKRALEAAVQEVLPNSEFDRSELFRAFRPSGRTKMPPMGSGSRPVRGFAVEAATRRQFASR